MLLVLLHCASSVVFGVDYGTEFIKVGMALPGKAVHVALNQQSKRLSPAYFAFWRNESPANSTSDRHWTSADLKQCSWSFLDAAKSHGNRFPRNVIQGLSPLLGNEHGFKRRESLALVIRHLLTTVDEGRWSPDKATVVFSIEPELPYEERVALGEAMKLTNATLAAVIDSPTAAATTYALEKRSLYAEGPKVVAFVDVGAQHTWASVFRLVPCEGDPEVEELAVAVNYSLGGRLIDEKVANRLRHVFEEQNQIEVKSERALKQFYLEAVRVKELLSINDFVDVRMEDVIEEYGLNYKFSRKEFEGMIEEWEQSLNELYLNVLSKANLSVSDVDSIELLGGSTRVPFIKNALMKISGMEKLNRTMNSDEAIALGAGYIGATRSSSFVVKSVKIKPLVCIEVILAKGGDTTVLFAASDRITDTVNVTYKVNELQEFSLIAGENHTSLLTFSVVVPEDREPNDEVTLVFGFNHLHVPTIINASINGTLLKVRTKNPDWMMDNDQMIESRMFIKRMDRILASRHKYQKHKNEFESYIYKTKDRIEYDSTFQSVLSEEDRKTISDTIAQCLNWFSEAKNPSSKEISKKFADLKSVTRDAEIRAEQMTRRGPALQQMKETLATVFKSLNSTWPEFRKWLPEKKVEEVWTIYNSTLAWFNEKTKLFQEAKPYDNPVVTDLEINRRTETLKKKHREVNDLKKPTPKPTPKPKPQPKAKEVENDNATQTDANETETVNTEL